jgi:F5/8 type C domain-containing protein
VRPVVFAEATASAVAAGAGTGTATAPWPGSFVLRARAPRLDAAPRIVTFPRQQARYVRVTIEPIGLAGSRTSIRTLSVVDGSCPTLDLALRKPATASSAALAPASSATDNPKAAASAVDGNPGTHWSPAPHDERPWIQLDLGEPVFFDQLCIVSDKLDADSLAIRVSISQDRECWTEPEPADDPLCALRLDFGTRLPACSTDCGPLHVQPDTETWQIYAINHTAVRVTGASLSARIYESFGNQLSHIEQQDVTIEPLSVAPGFVVSQPAYLPPTHLVSLQLHDADGALLSEHNCWRYRAETSPASARIRAR